MVLLHPESVATSHTTSAGSLPAVPDRRRVSIVLACYNRREMTLRCLASLFTQADANVELAVHLFDDGSSDGTAAAVRGAHPFVNIIAGDGDAYWGGGMAAAMRAALQTRSDFILWLNDDVVLDRSAISHLLIAHAEAEASRGPGPHLIVGAVADPNRRMTTYAGWRRRNAWHPIQLERVEPNGGLNPAETMNGNCVLIPTEAANRIGAIDPNLVHQLGDIDYGYRAVQSGCRIWVAPEPIGTCAPNLKVRPWTNTSRSSWERLRALFSPLGMPPKAWITFMWRYAGPRGILLLSYTYAKALLAVLRPRTAASARRSP